MIADERIDLTQESNFGRRSHILPSFLNDITMFPWNCKPIKSQEDFYKSERTWGDSLSDQMQCLVRRTSNNKWFFGQKLENYWYDAYGVFNELLAELGIFDNIYGVCCKCGRRSINHSIFELCTHCMLEEHYKETYNKLFQHTQKMKYISWQNHQFGLFEDIYGNNIEIFVPTKQLIEDLVQS